MCKSNKKCKACKIAGITMARKRRRSRVSGLPFDATTIAGAAGGAVVAQVLTAKVEFLKANPKVDGVIKLVAGGYLASQGGFMGSLGVGMIGQGGITLAKDLAPKQLGMGGLPAGVGPNRTFIAGNGARMRQTPTEPFRVQV